MGTFLKTLNNNKMSPEDFILSTTGYYTHINIPGNKRTNQEEEYRFIIIYLKNKNRYQRCIILFTITHTHTHT